MGFSWFTRDSSSNRNGRRVRRAARSQKAKRRRGLRLEVLEGRALLSAGAVAVTYHQPHLAANGMVAMATSAPSGYSPTQIRTAYGINNIVLHNSSGAVVKADGAGTTIAIVDAYNDPNIVGDLNAFDQQFNLPAPPSFVQENQSGGSALPAPNSGWATEIALDVEWAHAIAPGANILLVEANDASISNLVTAVSTASHTSGVVAVSMSWGGGESSSQLSYDSTFSPATAPGVTFLASSGDTGATVSYPASSPNVISVGGTTLNLNQQTGAYVSESGWSDSGGGVSAVEAQPGYQKGVVTQTTTRRANPDVAYDSDPATGFPVYDSYDTSAPWGQWGGTSDAAPQWAGLIAIADEGRMLLNEAPLSGASQTLPLLYSLAGSGDFHDITSGTSSSGGRNAKSYSAGPGYDLVTGLGTPHADLIVSALVGDNGATPAPPPNPTPAQSPTHFSVTTSAGTTVGSAVNVTITALDANNQQVSGYLGTLQLTSSDPLATSGSAANKLPIRYTFVAGDGGSHTFSVTLATTGNQTITATDVTTASIVGQATVAVAPAPTTTATTIEDFEGNPTYNVAGFWTGNFTLSTAAAHDGNYGLDAANGNDWIYRDDAAAQIQQGDSVSVWLKFAGSADGRAYFGFGATAAGTLSLVAAPNTGQLLLQNNPGYGFANSVATSQSWLPNHWYRLEVDWGTSGLLIGKLFDGNGTTLLNSVTAMTSGFVTSQ